MLMDKNEGVEVEGLVRIVACVPRMTLGLLEAPKRKVRAWVKVKKLNSLILHVHEGDWNCKESHGLWETILLNEIVLEIYPEGRMDEP